MRPPLPSGVYAIVDDSAARPPLDSVAAFVRGGAAVVQLRLKRAGAGELVSVAREARKLCAGRALLLVNDRPDVARLAEADGVHLGQEDLPWQEARAIVGADALVGVSSHGDEELDAAQGADYAGFGPVFATASKPGAPLPPPHGIPGLSRAVRRSRLPVVAIGGIDEKTAAEVARAGARCVAAIAALCNAADPERAVARLRAAFEAGAR